MTKPQTPTASDLQKLPFGLRVRALRLEAGLTQDDLAERMGTTKATISKMERSTNTPKGDWVQRLSNVLGNRIAQAAYEQAAGARPVSMMPVIGMIAAGNWREAVRETDEFVPVVEAKPHMFVLRVDGDSVDRLAPDGSFVSIDPTDPTLKEGKLYAVQNGAGETTLKVFRREPDRLEPNSSNPLHKPIPLGKEPVTIIGRATSVIRVL